MGSRLLCEAPVTAGARILAISLPTKTTLRLYAELISLLWKGIVTPTRRNVWQYSLHQITAIVAETKDPLFKLVTIWSTIIKNMIHRPRRRKASRPEEYQIISYDSILATVIAIDWEYSLDQGINLLSDMSRSLRRSHVHSTLSKSVNCESPQCPETDQSAQQKPHLGTHLK